MPSVEDLDLACPSSAGDVTHGDIRDGASGRARTCADYVPVPRVSGASVCFACGQRLLAMMIRLRYCSTSSLIPVQNPLSSSPKDPTRRPFAAKYAHRGWGIGLGVFGILAVISGFGSIPAAIGRRAT